MSDSTIGELAAQDSYDPFAAEQFVNPAVQSAIGSLATLPQRAIQNSQYALDTGTYDPSVPLEAASLPLGTGAIAGVPLRGGETALGAGAVRAKMKAPGALFEPAHKAGTAAEQIDTAGWPNLPYVTDPQRVYKPGVYKDPRVIAAEANARVAPEHPALQQLFGVTRQDLYDISQQGTRQGNVAPNIWQPKKPGGSYAAENIMNPANALSEYRTMAPWFRQNVAQPLGLEAVPTQALTWGAYAPQTGVKTPIGAGKLELLSQRIWERAQKLGVDPRTLRDKVLLGEQHAELGGGMGSVAAQDQYG